MLLWTCPPKPEFLEHCTYGIIFNGRGWWGCTEGISCMKDRMDARESREQVS
jgi:hypothetical protein